MAIVKLDNSDWGFESNCFVCEQANERGLQIPFAFDDEATVVFADFVLDRPFSGAPQYAHGGIVLAILDEAMAWAAIAVGHRFAMTRETTAVFERPVRLGQSYRVEARLDDASDDAIHATALVKDENGKCRARANGLFVPLGLAQANAVLGVDLVDGEATYLAPDHRG
jgi:acyl-coenzyme A thioesterase PaaI-like protein